jgi:aromatic-L-amino-acid decarboxylase
LRLQLESNRENNNVAIALAVNGGVTSTGAIDLLKEIGEIASQHGIWFHIDGSYGLPGTLIATHAIYLLLSISA